MIKIRKKGEEVKSVKPYHIRKYTVEDFVSKYAEIPQIVDYTLPLEDTILKVFGERKMSYREIVIKQNKINNAYFKRANRKKSHQKIEEINSRKSLMEKYKSEANRIAPQKIKDAFRIIYGDDIPLDDLRKQSIDLGDLNIIRILDGRRSAPLYANWDALIYYIETYYESRKDFLVSLILTEKQFLYSGGFREIIKKVASKIGIPSADVSPLIKMIYGIYRSDYTEMYSCKVDEKYRVIILKKILDESFLIKYSFCAPENISLIEELPKIVDMSYNEIRRLIFMKANYCSSVIHGDRTLDSYILPFLGMLNKEDRKILTENVLFIGNNSIKISKAYEEIITKDPSHEKRILDLLAELEAFDTKEIKEKHTLLLIQSKGLASNATENGSGNKEPRIPDGS